MWLHIVLAVGTAALAILAGVGRIPGQKILNAREWKLLLFLLAAGNGLGAWMSYTRNSGRHWDEKAYFEKQPAGEGSYEEEMQLKIQGEETSVYLRIPEQEGAEETKEEPDAVPTPGLDEAIQQAVAKYNQENPSEDRYYLPTHLDGERLSWTRPWDASGAILAALCVVGACCIPIQKQRAKEQMRQKRARQMLLDYPGFVTRLSLLLEAGMTVRRAFGKIALDYKRKKDATVRYAYEELLKSYYEMEGGVMEEQAYENFGKRCGHPKYRTLASLLIQNLKKGNRQLLEILEKESAEAFEERKRYARVQGEAAATKLLIPMVLMLLIVLIILIVPAFLSFYQT